MRDKCVLCVVLGCALPAMLVAEVQVNVRTSGSQTNPSVAVEAAGGSVIVWSSYFSTSGRSNDILARRLDPLGNFAGGEFQVNIMSEGNQTEPAVVARRQGGFAVAWQGPGLDQEDIFLRLFDPNGRPTTDEMLVNSRTAGRQLSPSIAMRGTSLIIAWESREIVDDVNRVFVRAEVFEPNGTALSEEVMLDNTTYDGRYPEVAADSSGRFAVTWIQDRSSHPILARLFDPNGVPVTDVFQVNDEGIASLTRPSIAMNSPGHFVITWDGDPSRGSDDDIHARLYDPDGLPASKPFVVNTIRNGAQQWPQVAINDTNEFVIVWEHQTDDPNTTPDICARRFDSKGQPVGDQFQLNTYTQDRQRYPDVGVAVDGSFIAAWGSESQDGSSYGVFAHIAAPAVAPDPNKGF
jgi:hypothetical protein